MTSGACEIIIGICPFRRAHIAATLQSLAAIEQPPEAALSVIVADNDIEPKARAEIEAVLAGLPFSGAYLHAPSQNISIARNAILDAARARGAKALVFIDDDETVEPGWLVALWQSWQVRGSAAVIGPVRAHYAKDAPPWMVRGAVHDTVARCDAQSRAQTGYTCNTLISLEDDALRDLRFDLSRGRSGGEDTVFFDQIRKRGGEIFYTDAAVVHETVPPERARLSWLLARRYRMGQTHGRLLCAGAGGGARLKHALVAGAKALACGGLYLRHLGATLGRNTALTRGALHIGVISACLGNEEITLYGASGDAPETEGART